MGVMQAEREVVNLSIALVDGSDPRLHVRPLINAGKPTGLSPHALAAIERVLVRGVARILVDGGGEVAPWRSGAQLKFGSATLDLLHWLHATKVNEGKRPALKLRAPLLPLDAFLAARAIELVRAAGGAVPKPLTKSPWVWLFAGEALAAAGAAVPDTLLWRRVFAEPWLLDCTPRHLHGVWSSWARTSRAVDLPQTIAHGEAQEKILTGFLGAIDRPPRAGFLGDLMVDLAELPAGVWNIDRGKESLARWQNARRARAAVIRTVCATLSRWEAEWRAVGFVEDEYREVQGHLRRFERALAAVRRLSVPIARSEQLPSDLLESA